MAFEAKNPGVQEIDAGAQIKRVLRAASASRLKLFLFAMSGLIVGGGIATVVPDLYQSKTLLLVRERQLIEDSALLRSIEDKPLAVKEQTLEQELKSFIFVNNVLKECEWLEYAEAVSGGPADVQELVEKVRDDKHYNVELQTSPTTGELMIQISFRWSRPDQAFQFVLHARKDWVRERDEENKRYYRSQLQDAERLLEERQRAYDIAAQNVEDFQRQNNISGVTDENVDLQLKTTLMIQSAGLESKAAELEVKIRGLEDQLSQTPEKIEGSETKTKNTAFEAAQANVNAAAAKLKELQEKKKESHPDVKKQAKVLAEAQAAFENVKGKGEFTASAKTSDLNPVWLEIKKSIDAFKPELDGARNQLLAVEKQMDAVDERLAKLPSLQATLRTMENDYTVAQQQINAMRLQIAPLRDKVARWETASAGIFVDPEDALTKTGAFQILEEPVAAKKPEGLPKAIFWLTGFLLGLAAGFALLMLSEMTRKTLDDADEIQATLGLPVLGAIGNISTPAENRRIRMRAISHAVGSLLIVAALGAFVFVMTSRPDLLPPWAQHQIQQLKTTFQ